MCWSWAHGPLCRRLLCRFPLVVVQQTPQSFSTLHRSHVPSCLRPRRKQDPIVVALMFALLVVVEQVGRQQPFEMPLIQDDHVAANWKLLKWLFIEGSTLSKEPRLPWRVPYGPWLEGNNWSESVPTTNPATARLAQEPWGDDAAASIKAARVNSTGEHMQILVSVVIIRERKMLGAPLAAGTVSFTFLRNGQTNAAGAKLGLACRLPIWSINSTQKFGVGPTIIGMWSAKVPHGLMGNVLVHPLAQRRLYLQAIKLVAGSGLRIWSILSQMVVRFILWALTPRTVQKLAWLSPGSLTGY